MDRQPVDNEPKTHSFSASAGIAPEAFLIILPADKRQPWVRKNGNGLHQ
jgi:hypothetical protein